MGFNPRLAPFSITKQIEVRETSKDAAVSQHFPILKAPFAGQLVGAYANVRKIQAAGTAMDAAQAATTNTGVDEISIWNYATADTTATYATGLRMAARTGDQDSVASDGLNWGLPPTSGVAAVSGTPGLYTLTNKSAARRKFLAGDVLMMHISPYGATNSHRVHAVDVQVDYIIGHEAS